MTNRIKPALKKASVTSAKGTLAVGRSTVQTLWRLGKKLDPPPAVKRFIKQMWWYSAKPIYLRYLKYLARRSASISWDRTRLVEHLANLHSLNIISIEDVKNIITDPRIKGLSKYLEVDTITGKLLITNHELDLKLAAISKIIDQILPHDEYHMSRREWWRFSSRDKPLDKESTLEEITDQWEDFFKMGGFTLEELQVLQEELISPIPPSKILLYQSYINFAQTFRATNNGISNSILNNPAINFIHPDRKWLTSTTALRHIQQVAHMGSNDFAPSTLAERIAYYYRLFRGRATFLERFQKSLRKVEAYHQKVLGRELKARGVSLHLNEPAVDDAIKAAIGKRKIFEKLYMGCTAKRFSKARVKAAWPFVWFLLANSLVTDALGYAHQTPDEDLNPLDAEYWRQLHVASKVPRWRKILGYELTATVAFSVASNSLLKSPLTGTFEKWSNTYFVNGFLSIFDNAAFQLFFGQGEAYAENLLEELRNREDFDQLQNRIWQIIEDAGLADELQLALEQVAKTGETGAHSAGEITLEALNTEEVQQVLKEIPAALAERDQAALKDLQGVLDVGAYAQLRKVDRQTALTELEQVLNNPEKRAALEQLIAAIESSNLREKVRQSLAQTERLVTNHTPSEVSVEGSPAINRLDLLDERVMEIMTETLTDAAYEAQAGEVIKTGNMGSDRFVYYRTSSLPFGAKSVFMGLYIYQVICRGNQSIRSYFHAGAVKAIDSMIFSSLSWNLRNCTIGKGKEPTLEDILFPKEKNNCQDIFFEDEIDYIFD